MTNIQLPKISLDKLLQLEVGEEGTIIVPISNKSDFKICKKIADDNGDSNAAWEFDDFISDFSPLQPNEEFYIGEEFQDNGYTGLIYRSKISEDSFLNTDWQEASKMASEQSRFHGIYVGVEVKKLESFGELYVVETIELFNQHNKLHNTNIEPSLDDYVFYITVRRVN